MASQLLFGSCHSREETTTKEQTVPKWEKNGAIDKIIQ